MFKKVCTMMLAALLIQAVFCVKPAAASSKAEKAIQRTEKVKAGILKLGVGRDARVALKLRGDVKLAGYISEVASDPFVVKDLNTGAAAIVNYGDVAQVKGHNLSTGAKIAIGIGIGVRVTLLVLYLIFANYQGRVSLRKQSSAESRAASVCKVSLQIEPRDVVRKEAGGYS